MEIPQYHNKRKAIQFATLLLIALILAAVLIVCYRTLLGVIVPLVTVVVGKKPAPERDFLPLTVDYQEKTYAAGRIPGGFFRREGRPSETEILTSRLIDRPIRPLFAEGFTNEVQVIATLLLPIGLIDKIVGVGTGITVSVPSVTVTA